MPNCTSPSQSADNRPHTMQERLIATCEHNNVKWFEDPTNHDATYTRRNAIRQLLTASPPRLPRALQRDSLVSISRRASVRNRTIQEAALRLLHAHCKPCLNPRTGTLRFSLPHDHAAIRATTKPVQMRLLVELAELASPAHRVETRQMLTVFERVFSTAEEDDIPTFTAGGLTWTYRGKQEWVLDREPLAARKREQVTELAVVEHGWSEWELWDGRWWIRVQPPAWVERCYVRVLGGRDMKTVRAAAVERGMKAELEEVLRELKMGIRFTVPALFWSGGGEEVLVGLPTVGLDLVDNAGYQVRFKD